MDVRPPQDFHSIDKTCLITSQYMQWKMSFSDKAKTNLHTLDHSGRMISGVQLSYKIFIGEGGLFRYPKENNFTLYFSGTDL